MATRKRATLSFERLKPGHYWAVKDGVGYEIKRKFHGDYRAAIFEPEDADHGQPRGTFSTLAAAQVALRQDAGRIAAGEALDHEKETRRALNPAAPPDRDTGEAA
jgi:hypothetical protein